MRERLVLRHPGQDSGSESETDDEEMELFENEREFWADQCEKFEEWWWVNPEAHAEYSTYRPTPRII